MRADISLTQGKYVGVPSSRESLGLPELRESSEEAESDQDDELEQEASGSEMDDDSSGDDLARMHDAVYKKADLLAAQSAKQTKDNSIKIVNNIEKDLRKAKHTRHQQKIWDHLLKLRIKEQRSLTIANRLPQMEMLDLFKESTPEVNELTSRISTSIQEVLGSY